MANKKIHYLTIRELHIKGELKETYKDIDCPVGLRDGNFMVSKNIKEVTCKACRKIFLKRKNGA